ncbi:hypothetical protein KP78_16990 [Jeotgalibacillus soli]|uniref:Uncharacterized protein n=1 Tax=Jeotgalibacillus soli TaxID=889306 RepID=A0A0C2VW91_9BACL|nr:hypothetical protein KP78_16990 [Jeotgalibacillus soli]
MVKQRVTLYHDPLMRWIALLNARELSAYTFFFPLANILLIN